MTAKRRYFPGDACVYRTSRGCKGRVIVAVRPYGTADGKRAVKHLLVCNSCGQAHGAPEAKPDEHGNRIRNEGCDRCVCGCKYWENDRCIDCGSSENVQLTEEGKVVTQTATRITTVGKFSFDSATRVVTGPADYMRSDDYRRCIASIEGGTNHTFRAACEHSPTIETALLVTIHTNYAAWHGMKSFNRQRQIAEDTDEREQA